MVEMRRKWTWSFFAVTLMVGLLSPELAVAGCGSHGGGCAPRGGVRVGVAVGGGGVAVGVGVGAGGPGRPVLIGCQGGGCVSRKRCGSGCGGGRRRFAIRGFRGCGRRGC